MQPLLLRLVAVVSSLVLALPPGWCGGFMRHERAVPAPSAPPAKTTCCHHTATDQPSEPEQPPAPPTVECCCQRDATVPEKSVQPTDAPALVLPLVIELPADLGGQSRYESAGVLLPPHPRLHVLQCVWRC
jgi:hypothetical protein